MAPSLKRELKTKEPREGQIIMGYFKNKKIGVLKNALIDIERIFCLKKKIGGQLILCHPAKHHFINKELWRTLKEMGLNGVELISPHHSYGAVMHIQYLARQLGLITTGGSDFHRAEGGGYAIQRSWDYFKINSDYLKGINKIIKQ